MTEPKIIFEDEDLLVIDKPSGMVVNRAETTVGETTVQDWVEKYLKSHATCHSGTSTLVSVLSLPKDLSRINSGCAPSAAELTRMTETEFLNRSGIVHRLDKETSGLLVIAKNLESFSNLQAQFKNRQVVKKYLALVHGKVAPSEGEIKAPIARLPWNRKRFGVFPGGRPAQTQYKVLSVKYKLLGKKREPLTFLEICPLTGRTHQIRVHLKYAGHPVVGDLSYSGRKTAREDRKFCPRLFLHATYLKIFHPRTGEKMEFRSPLPEDLGGLLPRSS